jgi:hypothetical protein
MQGHRKRWPLVGFTTVAVMSVSIYILVRKLNRFAVNVMQCPVCQCIQDANAPRLITAGFRRKR